MKTTWSIDYITGKYGPRGAQEWVKAKREQLEQEEGVPWSSHVAHGKFVFMPTWDRNVQSDAEMADKLLGHLGTNAMDARNFLSLAVACSMTLRQVVRRAKWLCEHGRAVPVIDRMGKPVAIYRKESRMQFSQSRSQAQQMCRDFLRMKKGMTLDAIEASRMILDEWGVRIDWHEMSDALESLDTCEDAERVFVRGHDRMSTYLIR